MARRAVGEVGLEPSTVGATLQGRVAFRLPVQVSPIPPGSSPAAHAGLTSLLSFGHIVHLTMVTGKKRGWPPEGGRGIESTNTSVVPVLNFLFFGIEPYHLARFFS